MSNPDVDIWRDPERLQEYRESHPSWPLNATGYTLTGIDYSGWDFSGIDFRRATLDESNLTRATLKGAYCASVRAHGTTFDHAHLSKANFSNAQLESLPEKPTSLSAIVGAGLQLDSADLTRVDLSDARLSRADYRKTKFVQADLSHANLSGGLGTGANFTEADLRHTDLSDCELTDTEWYRARINYGTCLARAEFANSHDARTDGYQTIKTPGWTRLVNWSNLRLAARLPLFEGSSILLTIAVLTATAIEWLNATRFVEALAYPIPIPPRLGLLLLGSTLLTVGSLVFEVFCPARVKEYSLTAWVADLGQAGVVWIVDSINRPIWNLIAGGLLVPGMLIAIYLLVDRLIAAFTLMTTSFL